MNSYPIRNNKQKATILSHESQQLHDDMHMKNSVLLVFPFKSANPISRFAYPSAKFLEFTNRRGEIDITICLKDSHVNNGPWYT